jgi:hypothetical protein
MRGRPMVIVDVMKPCRVLPNIMRLCFDARYRRPLLVKPPDHALIAPDFRRISVAWHIVYRLRELADPQRVRLNKQATGLIPVFQSSD